MSRCFRYIVFTIDGLYLFQTLTRPLTGRMVSPYPAQDGTDVVLSTDESHLTDVKNTITLLSDLFKVITM